MKQGLNRLIASNPKGRNDWPSCIPKLIHTINSYFPYKSLLSRVQLFFNPWYSTNTSLQVLNPLKLQQCQYETLNNKRIQNLTNKGRGAAPKDIPIGSFVLLSEEGPTVEGSRQLNVPLSKDLFKVISRHKNGFSLGILNIRTLDRHTIVHTQ